MEVRLATYLACIDRGREREKKKKKKKEASTHAASPQMRSKTDKAPHGAHAQSSSTVHPIVSVSAPAFPSLPGGDGWASGGAIRYVFAVPFACDEHAPGPPYGARSRSSLDAEDGGGGGGGENQSSMMVVKTEAVCANGGPLVAAPDLAEDQGGDTIECSSSFGETSSGFDGEADGGEPEVNSVVSTHANGGWSSKLARRKKVASEWRNSVRPVLWRCQWLELRLKELSSQVSKYDRELALIKKEKELQQAVSKANGSMSEPVQIHKGHGNSIMKRRKRKRHEQNVDASLYINKHKILSYYHDKKNKGAETGGLLIDDDCGGTENGKISGLCDRTHPNSYNDFSIKKEYVCVLVKAYVCVLIEDDGSIRGGLDTVTLLDSENYDMIFQQLTLKDTLMTIDGLQSRVNLLQDLLSKAHSGGESSALSEDNSHVRVPRKRQHSQKRPFSFTKCRYTKPQKRKNLNILLKGDDGPDLNIDDILIDNQAANEVFQQFGKASHLPFGTLSKGQNISGPAEVKNICAPAAPVLEPVSRQSKQVYPVVWSPKSVAISTWITM
ncbi:uncharacterized protein C2845_PM07G38670 [Panicum miliaceum]|uniref:Uncharacterized protein n=1 Tax=Panicum miliaceum TaxID=4540 RepID=A0A3L6SI01_PANMI|nr:uncharacterized protein C2845_PM07G38670 [Panicum miliaceum]